MERKGFFIQERLSPTPEQRQDYYVFPEGITIFPLHSGRGVLTEDLQAIKTERRVGRYTVWKAENPIHLYSDRKHWQLSSGTEFSAPVKSAKKRKI